MVRSGPNSNSSEILCMSSLPASIKRVGSKTTEKRWRHRSSHYKSMGAFCCHRNQRFDPICPKTLCSLFPTLVMLHIKFDLTFSITIVHIIYDVTYVSLSNISCLFVLSYIKPKLNYPILLTTVLLLFQIKTATRFVAHYLNITSGYYI